MIFRFTCDREDSGARNLPRGSAAPPVIKVTTLIFTTGGRKRKSCRAVPRRVAKRARVRFCRFAGLIVPHEFR